MRLNDALENEKNRKESESWNKIYLHKDGSSFTPTIISTIPYNRTIA